MENGEYKRLLERALVNLSDDVKRLTQKVDQLSNDVAGMKVKASIFAGVGLALIAVSYAIINLLSQ